MENFISCAVKVYEDKKLSPIFSSLMIASLDDIYRMYVYEQNVQ